MKPKNKLQERVLLLHKRNVAPLTRIKQWAFNNLVKHTAYLCNGVATCLSCAYENPINKKAEISKIKCVGCKRYLLVEKTRRLKDSQEITFSELKCVQNFQVLRTYNMKVYFNRGEKPLIGAKVVMEDWIDENFNHVFISRVFSSSFGNWSSSFWSQDLEIRQSSKRDLIVSYFRNAPLYNRGKLLDEFQLRGLDIETIAKFQLGDVLDVILNLSNPIAETLLKTGKLDLLKEMNRYRDSFNKYWRSLRLALKNKYVPTDISIWFDYLELLEFKKKDIFSPKYICPEDLHREHSKYLRYKLEQDDFRNSELLQFDNKKYKERIQKYKHLHFEKDNISIKLLQDVIDFKVEGKILNHCVFTNSYYNKKNRLVFSAKVDNNHIETIEYDIKKHQVLQQRGLGNTESPFNEEIKNLFYNNINKIKQIA